MAVETRINSKLDPLEVSRLFDRTNFPRADEKFSRAQIQSILENSNLIVSAHSDAELIGIAVSMTNYVSLCMLAYIAVDTGHQNHGIGKLLISQTRDAAGGNKISIVTVSTTDARQFYENIGFENCRNGFIKLRTY